MSSVHDSVSGPAPVIIYAETKALKGIMKNTQQGGNANGQFGAQGGETGNHYHQSCPQQSSPVDSLVNELGLQYSANVVNNNVNNLNCALANNDNDVRRCSANNNYEVVALSSNALSGRKGHDDKSACSESSCRSAAAAATASDGSPAPPPPPAPGLSPSASSCSSAGSLKLEKEHSISWEAHSPPPPPLTTESPSKPPQPPPQPPQRQVKFQDESRVVVVPRDNEDVAQEQQPFQVSVMTTAAPSSVSPLAAMDSAGGRGLDAEDDDTHRRQQPQITVSFEPMPPDEDHAFRTKIDSSYEGWDNPFRPDGEISHEAEELLKLWKEGKLRRGQEEQSDDRVNSPAGSPSEDAPNADTKPLLSNAANGRNPSSSPGSAVVEVKRDNMPLAVSAKHDNLKEEAEPKKKKSGCCSVM